MLLSAVVPADCGLQIAGTASAPGQGSLGAISRVGGPSLKSLNVLDLQRAFDVICQVVISESWK